MTFVNHRKKPLRYKAAVFKTPPHHHEKSTRKGAKIPGGKILAYFEIKNFIQFNSIYPLKIFDIKLKLSLP